VVAVSIVLLVVGILLLVTLVIAAILVPFALRWKRGRDEYWGAFDASVAAGGEQILLPVQSAIYRSGTPGAFSQAKGNGKIVLTTKRLLFRKITGGIVEVPTAQIAGVHRSKSFNGSIVGGHEHLVVDLVDGTGVAYFVTDTDLWERQIQQLSAR
jgi:hypothetical protein